MTNTKKNNDEQQYIKNTTTSTKGIISNSYSNLTLHVVAGALSRVSESFIMFPLDTLKTKLQFNQKSTLSNNGSVIRTLVIDTAKKEGIRGFYRGFIPHLLYVAPAASISFVCYEAIVKAIVIPILGMGLARVVGSIMRTPFDQVKMRQQVYHTSALQTYKSIIKSKNGYYGLFKFSYVSLLRDIPYTALYFSSYELFRYLEKKYFLYTPNNNIKNNNSTSATTTIENKQKLKGIHNLVAGSAAGAISTIITNPIDVIKTKVQTSQNLNITVSDAFKQIFKSEGVHGFTKGLLIRLIHIVPSAGISFASYEFFKNILEAHI
eukprot:gene687-848_t